MNPYNNTVEVLSPNPPSEPTVEDQSFRTTKDDLLQQISKVILMAFLVDYMKIIVIYPTKYFLTHLIQLPIIITR